MKVLKISRLFYGKFPYKVTFRRESNINDHSYHTGWTPFNCKTWLTENAIEHRMYNQVLGAKKKSNVRIKGSLFLMKSDDLDIVKKKWGKFIDSITEPYSEDHVDILKENTKILIRTKPIYGKYRYVVKFRRTWADKLLDVDEWIVSNLGSTGEKIKWTKEMWIPTLYLSLESDFFLVKMAWSDKILETYSVLTINDLENQQESAQNK